MVVDFFMGDILKLRKAHPCGEDRWQVVRLGADIGLRCLGCQHRVLMDRRTLERQIKARLSSGSEKVSIF